MSKPNHQRVRAIGRAIASLVVLGFPLACMIPTAVAPPPPITAQIGEGGGEAAGTITGQVMGTVGGPEGSSATRSAGLGGTTGITLQATPALALRAHVGVDPAGGAPGEFGRVGLRFNFGFGALSNRYARDAAAMETARSRGIGAALTIDLGGGAGGYNSAGGCSIFSCTGSFARRYEQGDLGVHLVVSAYGVVEFYVGFVPAIGSMFVAGSDQTITYIGGDTGMRVRLPGHLALSLAASYHSASGSLVYIQDAEMAQVSFGLQWTSPQIWRPRALAPRATDGAQFVPIPVANDPVIVQQPDPNAPQSLPPIEVTPMPAPSVPPN